MSVLLKNKYSIGVGCWIFEPTLFCIQPKVFISDSCFCEWANRKPIEFKLKI